MTLHVLKHPDDSMLAKCIEAADGANPPQGYESMTVAEFKSWEAQEIANGWTPILPPPPPKTDAEIYAEHLALGYLDPVTGIKLKTVETAQAKFTSQVALLQVALGAGAITTSSDTQIWDYENQPHTLTVAGTFGLLLRYGLHCQYLFATYGP